MCLGRELLATRSCLVIVATLLLSPCVTLARIYMPGEDTSRVLENGDPGDSGPNFLKCYVYDRSSNQNRPAQVAGTSFAAGACYSICSSRRTGFCFASTAFPWTGQNGCQPLSAVAFDGRESLADVFSIWLKNMGMEHLEGEFRDAVGCFCRSDLCNNGGTAAPPSGVNNKLAVAVASATSKGTAAVPRRKPGFPDFSENNEDNDEIDTDVYNFPYEEENPYYN